MRRKVFFASGQRSLNSRKDILLYLRPSSEYRLEAPLVTGVNGVVVPFALMLDVDVVLELSAGNTSPWSHYDDILACYAISRLLSRVWEE